MDWQRISRWTFFASIIIAIMPHVSALFYLTVLHQNDIHSHFDIYDGFDHNCINTKSHTCYGGFSRAVAAVNHYIKNDEYSKNLLIVNAGDFYNGHQYYSQFKWQVVADLVKHMPYTALALGDAEFTDGLEGLLPFLRVIGEKFVCTNINFESFRTSNETLYLELSRLCPRHRIISYENGTRHVCLLGYTTPMTDSLLVDSRIVFENEEQALTDEVRRVRRDRPDVKIFVALGHSGYERDKEIAHRVPSLDVIVGGHSHTLLWPNIRNKMVAGLPDDPRDKGIAKDVYPTVVIQPSGRKVLIVQSYKHGKYFGVLNVTFNDDDEVVNFFTSPKLLTKDMTPDAMTEKTLKVYREKLKEHQKKTQGSTRMRLNGNSCNSTECNFGNLVTDAMLWHMRQFVTGTRHTLVAFINGFSIKKNIEPGDITMANITESLPYADTVTILELKGATIRKMLEYNVKYPLPGDVRSQKIFLQFSGLHVRYNLSRPEESRVVSVQVLHERAVPRFEALNDSDSYKVVTYTYLAEGNLGFTMLKERISTQARHDFNIDIVQKYVARFSPLYPKIEGRIEVVSVPGVNNTAASTHGWRAGRTAAAAASLALPVTLLVRCR